MELWAALVTAVAALLVAIVGLITAFLGQKQSARANTELERRRHRQHQHDEHLKALQEGIRAIQEVKDALQLVLEGFPDAVDLPRSIDLIEKTRGHLTDCYEGQMTLLGDDDRKALHDAKNVAVNVEIHLARLAKDTASIPGELPDGTVAFLRSGRQQLGERQQLLRDSLLRQASSLV